MAVMAHEQQLLGEGLRPAVGLASRLGPLLDHLSGLPSSGLSPVMGLDIAMASSSGRLGDPACTSFFLLWPYSHWALCLGNCQLLWLTSHYQHLPLKPLAEWVSLLGQSKGGGCFSPGWACSGLRASSSPWPGGVL